MVVSEKEEKGVSISVTKKEKACLEELEKDYQKVNNNIVEQASIVYDFGDSRLAGVSWLERTAFLSYLARLKHKEIKSSYELPRKRELNADAKDPNLVQIIAAAEAVLRNTYQLCSDTSPNRKMT